MKRIPFFLLCAVSGTLFQQNVFAEGRNIVDFATLYMNRIDRYSYWDNNVILEVSPQDLTTEVTAGEIGGQQHIRCLGGTATVEMENLDIVEFDMLSYPLAGGFSGDSYSEWEAKNIIAVSALEFDAAENMDIIKEGTYEGAVTKTIDVWKAQVDINNSLD